MQNYKMNIILKNILLQPVNIKNHVSGHKHIYFTNHDCAVFQDKNTLLLLFTFPDSNNINTFLMYLMKNTINIFP